MSRTREELYYKEGILNRFVKDMRNAGLEPYHYEGRWFWKGPAVNVDYAYEAMSETKVPCRTDSMGLGVVVYPFASGELLPPERKGEADHFWTPPEKDEEDEEEENEDE